MGLSCLISSLKGSGVIDNCILVLSGDHGQFADVRRYLVNDYPSPVRCRPYRQIKRCWAPGHRISMSNTRPSTIFVLLFCKDRMVSIIILDSTGQLRSTECTWQRTMLFLGRSTWPNALFRPQAPIVCRSITAHFSGHSMSEEKTRHITTRPKRCTPYLVRIINVIHKRAATTSEWPCPKHIVNAINYNLISQQRWSIGTFLYSIVLYI